MKNITISIWCVIITIMLSGEGFCANPPHPRIIKLLKDGKIKRPNFTSQRMAGYDGGFQSIQFNDKPRFKTYRNNCPSSSPQFKALALLVQFPDQSSSVQAASFDSILFGATAPSLRDYYSEISYGSMQIVAVNYPSDIGWSTVPQAYGYYVNGSYGMGDYPNNSQKLVEDAISAVDSMVDFSQYDNNEDGYVDALIIIHSGGDASWSGDRNQIWPHASITSAPVSVDGVYAYAYSIQAEYIQVPGDRTVGVFAHEMGHSVFGLPDLYDYDYDSRGLGGWSLMAFGSWLGENFMGEYPCHPDAWTRMKMGFVTPEDITSNLSGVSIPAVNQSGTVFRMWVDSAAQEYFLVENRQRVGYDQYLQGNGLCIYHIDEAQGNNDRQWYPGYADSGHYLVAIEQADGLWELERGLDDCNPGDPFPGSAGNVIFDSISSPNSVGYRATRTYVGVRNISNSALNMTADFQVAPMPTSIDLMVSDTPRIWRLDQNHPNPFNPTTTIRYELQEGLRVILKVHDLLGKEVAILVDELQAAGNHKADFDGTNLPSGIYFYTLQAGVYHHSKKLLLLR